MEDTVKLFVASALAFLRMESARAVSASARKDRAIIRNSHASGEFGIKYPQSGFVFGM
jgi:hypothetical protein